MRKMNHWLSWLGTGLVSYFAQLGDSGGGGSNKGEELPVQPCNTDGSCTPVRCCCLACAHVECPYPGSNKADFTCPTGYRTFWTCTEGTEKIGCGECAGGPGSCYIDPWYCSIWWRVN